MSSRGRVSRKGVGGGFALRVRLERADVVLEARHQGEVLDAAFGRSTSSRLRIIAQQLRMYSGNRPAQITDFVAHRAHQDPIPPAGVAG